MNFIFNYKTGKNVINQTFANFSRKKFNKKSYENAASSSDESYGDFDAKDPFKDDEIEAFNNESDKVHFKSVLLNIKDKKA